MNTNEHFTPSVGVLCISLSAILWGTVGIATQTIYQHSELNALTVGFYRLAVAFPFVGILCWKTVGREIFAVRLQSYLKMAFIGSMLAAYQVLYFAAVGSIGVALATLITLCTAPVVVALASVIFLRESFTKTTLTAFMCAISGTALLVGFQGDSGVKASLVAGVLMALGSAVGYATVALLGRSIAKECHPIHSTTVSFGAGAALLFPLAFVNLTSVEYTSGTVSMLLYVGLLPTAVAYSLFFLGMRSVKASTASVLTMIEPLTATVLAWIIFDERLTLAGSAGAVLLFFSIMVLCRREKCQK